MQEFCDFVKKTKAVSNWEDLHRWSVTATEEFWLDLANFVAVRWSKRGERPIYLPPTGGGMRGALWFPGWTLNFAQNLLPAPDPHREVLFCYSELWGER